MSPSRNGSCPGSAPSRNSRAASGSPYPRRTSTDAVVAPMPSASASTCARAAAHGAIVQVPLSIGRSSVRPPPDGTPRAFRPVHLVQSRAVLGAFLAVLRTIVALLVAAGLACAAASPAEVLQPIAPGVSVSGARLGGLTAQPASTAVRARFSR